MFKEEYELLEEAKNYVRRAIPDSFPQLGIILGSGLGDLASQISSPISIPYSEIPHFPKSTVVGHKGELIFGKLEGIRIVCMRGRVHLYEGYEVVECIRPVRLMAMLGIELLCVTNAAGNVNKNFKPGDFMIIRDHISMPALAGENPLRGKHDKRFGERFVTMSNAYDLDLISDLEEIGAKLGLEACIKKGVYAQVVGPTYETVAEAKLIKLLGADTIGMSTVHEIIAAHQMGVRCLGISLITNNCLLEYESMEDIVEHEHVVDMGVRRSRDFIRLVREFIKSLHKSTKFSQPPSSLENTNGKVTFTKTTTNGNGKVYA